MLRLNANYTCEKISNLATSGMGHFLLPVLPACPHLDLSAVSVRAGPTGDSFLGGGGTSAHACLGGSHPDEPFSGPPGGHRRHVRPVFPRLKGQWAARFLRRAAPHPLSMAGGDQGWIFEAG